MLYWIYELLKDPEGPNVMEKASNVLRYESFRTIAAALIALALALLTGNFVIRKLLSLKMGQPIRTAEEVRQLYALHEGKKGTPTMGGILIVLTFLCAIVVCVRWSNPYVWIVVGVTLALGALGFRDDYLKVTKKNSKGVSGKFKLAVQFGVAGAAGALLYWLKPGYFGEIWVPFLKQPVLHVGPIVFIALCMLVIVGSSNAVNLTDGLDGLAAGCTVPVAFTYGLFCYLSGHGRAAEYLKIPDGSALMAGMPPQGIGEVAITAFALLGAALGFLWFNCAPARVFMGDTGSLAIGGAVGALAVCCRQEFILLVVGFVFVLEALSVMLQVSWFKYTRKRCGEGRRLLKMSPLHHHFELSGWKETQVVVRFWILGFVCAFIGLATLKLR
jgi:phospho-N-acetylmuramoyl-pentapeptide-transferase